MQIQRLSNRDESLSLRNDRSIRVTTVTGLVEFDRRSAMFDAINAASGNPSPFHSAAFLRLYATRSEHFPDGIEPVVFLVSEGFDAIGWLAMRRRTEKLPGGIPGRRVEMLATHDNDRPGIVALAGRDSDVSDAIIEHLLNRESAWTLCEFRAQTSGSALYAAAHARSSSTLKVRDIAIDPYSEVSIRWTSLGAYFASLSKRMRSNVSRQARHLFATGNVEIVLAKGGLGVGALFDAYLELESRSWKQGGDVAIRRHSNRETFYRELAKGNAGLVPSFIGITIDGCLVAGLITGRHFGRSWCMEMCFDESQSDSGPGQLLLLLAINDAITEGDRSVNFLQMQPYFKQRWLAELHPVVNVQLIRRASFYNLKAVVGDRRRAASAENVVELFNDVKRESVQKSVARAEPSPLGQGRAILRGVLDQGLSGIRRLDTNSSAALLPFSVERSPSIVPASRRVSDHDG